ncbi:uncharacterized protein BO66DRAFT_439875 [Aspergillus aculeatinus CBS 121060]|uniref:Uncharacterized protein n=1 Tax=Aspergillus aculeatinus CBS 121060 TaxID=1448322 RepID=A0ACD1H5F7_9EURO|nr:hypothetical protein BO66DRAFT_439875 [Aspergillus aculeatinus CBS 121060]RAH68866.1 hypothetical protein BO66DRAFT_439875 [Aspergillus aculeatinus CBS 121060]
MTTETASLSNLRQTYDYLVVGGGTAGLVVANRLTEDPTVSVRVLEAGGNCVDDPRIAVPGLAASTYFDPAFDWCLNRSPTVDPTLIRGSSSAILDGAGSRCRAIYVDRKPSPHRQTRSAISCRLAISIRRSKTPMAMLSQAIGGVVDDQLRVYGYCNLRVVDAGVIPLIPRGNIQATVFVVVEKAADIIKESRQ